MNGEHGKLHRKPLLTVVRFGETMEADRLVDIEGPGHLAIRESAPNDSTEGVQGMDRFAGRTVADRADGHALLEERRHNHPLVGELSPDFELQRSDRTSSVRLSSYWGRKPVVLVFGSLT